MRELGPSNRQDSLIENTCLHDLFLPWLVIMVSSPGMGITRLSQPVLLRTLTSAVHPHGGGLAYFNVSWGKSV